MRAFEFIRTDVGLPGLPVTLVGYVPGVLSEANGPTHQALEDLALMRSVPGLEVYCPADRDELVTMLPEILSRAAPAYVRYNAAAPALEHAPFAAGRAEVPRPGAGGVSILACGYLLREALRAAVRLETHGVPVRVVNLRTLEPLDHAAVLEAARCELLVTLEDHFLAGGLFSVVSELLVRAGVRCPVLPIGFERRFFRPALLDDVLEVEGLHGTHVAQRVLDALRAPREFARLTRRDRSFEGAAACPIE
jgi:transketolase